MTATQRLRVAIIGGGIAGLTFAICLAKNHANVDVDIYESGPDFATAGAGLAMWPRIWAIMRELGLEEELRRRSTSVTGDDRPTLFIKGDQEQGYIYATTPSTMEPYHRAEFLQVLCEHTPKHFNTHFCKRLATYVDNPPEQVIMRFQDGTTAACDVIIGADGVKSSVRRNMFNQLADRTSDPKLADETRKHLYATWTGQVAYRHLISAEDLSRVSPDHPGLRQPVLFSGKNQSLICYPISQGRVINVAALVSKPEFEGTLYHDPWVTPVSQEELLEQYVNWDQRAQVILNLMKNPSKWVINSVDSLPTFTSGRVAIIGDAAHSMTPYQASGAGQAVEDGMVLSTLLAQPGVAAEIIPALLQVYDEVRRPFAQEVIQKSLRTGEQLFLQGPLAKGVTREASAAGEVPKDVLEKIGVEVADLLQWTWSTTMKGDIERAVQLFRQNIAQKA